MTTIEFITKCPCTYCRGDGPKLHWTCPHCNGYKTFNDDLLIKCKKGSCNSDHYIWNGLFKCGNHDEDYHETSIQGLLNILSAIGSAPNAPMSFIIKALATANANSYRFKC